MKTISSRQLSRPQRRPVRAVLTLLGPGALLAALIVNAPPASAQVVIAPPGCGIYSGQPIPAGYTVIDLSLLGCGVGTTASPYVVPVANQLFVIGTQCRDVIHGNGVGQIICGRGGPDDIQGGGGNDELFGGDDDDLVEGMSGSDLVAGNNGDDELYGEDAAGIIIFAGNTDDVLKGGDGFDTGDGGLGNDTCNVEAPTSC
jgi:RTX calcium-binding nonapeptide repeat (4 copies)